MAADGTVTGEFDLRVPALRKLRDLRREGERVDRTFESVGRTLDTVAGPVATRQLGSYRREVAQLGRTAQTSFGNYRRQWQASDRQVQRSVARQTTEIRSLRRELRGLSRQRTTVRIELTGVAKALADVELLMRRLNALDRRQVRANVGEGGGAAAAGAAARAGGGGIDGGVLRSVSLGPLNINPRAIGGMAAVALPAINSLTGAVTGLAASLASAAAGFGALGAAASGAGAVGLGSVFAAATPAIGRLKEAYKAQSDLTEARADDVAAAQQQRQSSEQMRSAQERLAGSQRSVLRAQRALTDARRDGRRALVDMSIAADRSRLSERRAGLEVQRARQELRRVTSDAMAGQTDRAEARLALEEAILGRREARIERGRSVADTRRAQAGGVEGLPSVRGAREGLAESRRELTNARRGLREAAQEMVTGATAITRAKSGLDKAFERAPRGTRSLLRDMRELRQLWGADETATGPARDPRVRRAQEGVVGILGGGARGLTRMTPTLGAAAERSVGAVGREGQQFGRFATGRESRRFIRSGAAMFDENLGSVRRMTEATATGFMRVSQAARPFFREALTGMARWTEAWRVNNESITSTRTRIGRTIRSLRDWKELGKATIGVMRALFRAGRDDGDSLVRSLTQWLNTQQQILNTREGQERLRRWFRESVDSVRSLASALWQILRAVGQISEALRPLLDTFTKIVTLAGESGLLVPGVLGGLWAMRRGRGGGGGGGAGAVAAGAAAGAGARGMFGRRGRGGGRRPPTGGLGSRIAAGGGRFARGAAPIMVGLGALEMLTFPGDTRGQNIQAGLATATNIPGIGPLVNPPVTRAMRHAQAGDITAGFMGRAHAGNRGTLGGNRGALSATVAERQRLEAAIRRSTQGTMTYGPGGQPTGVRREGMSAEARKLNQQRIDLLREEEKALGAVVKQQQAERDQRSAARAQTVSEQIQEGRRRVTRERGPAAGMAHMQRQAVAAINPSRSREGNIQLAKATLREAREQARANPKLWGEYGRLRKALKARLEGMRIDFSEVTTRLRGDADRQLGNIASSMREQARRGVDAASDEYQRLNREAMKALQGIGYSEKGAREVVRQMRRGRTRTQARTDVGRQVLSGNPAYRRARGGRVRASGGRLPGQGLQDTVPMSDGGLGAPGELVVNRHTESDVDRDLRRAGRPSLDQRVKREARPHSAPVKGQVTGRGGPGFHETVGPHQGHQTGGRLAGHSGRRGINVLGAKPGFAVLMSHFQNVGNDPSLFVMSGLRPGSVTTSGRTSNHAAGNAIDISNPVSRNGTQGNPPPVNSLDRVAQYISGNINRPPRLDFLWRTLTGGNHYNHIHLGMNPSVMGSLSAAQQYVSGLPGAGDYSGIFSTEGGGGAGAAAPPPQINLRSRRSGLRGITGAMADRAGQNYASGLEGQINAILRASGGPGGTGAVGDVAGDASGSGEALMRRIAGQRGWSFPHWWELDRRETSHGQNLSNPTSTARLRGQFLDMNWGKYGPGSDPRQNPSMAQQINSMARYIAERYGNPSKALGHHNRHNWYATGGRVPKWGGWHAKGGTGEFSSPTMIGVGDGQPTGGRERVTIERAGGGRGRVRDLSVTVNMGGVTVGADQDIEEMGERVANKVGEKLLAALNELEPA